MTGELSWVEQQPVGQEPVILFPPSETLAAFEAHHFDEQNPPVDNPVLFFEWLRWYHNPERLDRQRQQGIFSGVAEYDYSLMHITAEMLADALKQIATFERTVDLKDLGPAAISGLADDFKKGIGDRYKILAERRDGWKEKLQANLVELDWIMAPVGDIRVHSTTADPLIIASILKHGLMVTVPTSIDHTVKSLHQYRPSSEPLVDEKLKAATIEANLNSLSHPHKSQTAVFVLEFPAPTIEQRQALADEATEYNTPVADPATLAIITTIALNGLPEYVIDPRFIKGYIDLETGQFHSREDVLNSAP